MEELAAHASKKDVVLGHLGSFLIPTQVTMALSKEMNFNFASEAAFDALDCNTLASGDADVINTTLQLILPCLDDVTVLASIGEKRIPLTPDVPTVAEIKPSLDLALWNGLFVLADTPADIREKIAAVAKEVMASEKAIKLAAQTGALIYWKAADEASAQITKDAKTLEYVTELIEAK